jgi:hypothetical protein
MKVEWFPAAPVACQNRKRAEKINAGFGKQPDKQGINDLQTCRVDTRTLQVLCEIAADAKVYSGQRLTATFTTGNP